jgi:citrate lyase subunit beta/citryl-CoA lyase
MSGARSYLFVPGDSPRKLEKSAGSGADVLILDLEDAVAPERKVEARTLVRQALEGRDRSGPKMVVRVNALTTGLTEDDIAAVMPGRPDGVVLPKYETPENLEVLSTMLDAQERALGLERGSTQVIALVCETALGLLSLAANPPRHPRLTAMMWGAEDLAQDVGAFTNRDETGGYAEPFRLARSLCLMAAAVARVDAIDAVHVRLEDTEGLGRGMPQCPPRRFRRQGRDPPGPGRSHPRRLHPQRH